MGIDNPNDSDDRVFPLRMPDSVPLRSLRLGSRNFADEILFLFGHLIDSNTASPLERHIFDLAREFPDDQLIPLLQTAFRNSAQSSFTSFEFYVIDRVNDLSST